MADASTASSSSEMVDILIGLVDSLELSSSLDDAMCLRRRAAVMFTHCQLPPTCTCVILRVVSSAKKSKKYRSKSRSAERSAKIVVFMFLTVLLFSSCGVKCSEKSEKRWGEHRRAGVSFKLSHPPELDKLHKCFKMARKFKMVRLCETR